MKEIYDINIQRMNNGAHFTFVSNILARAEADYRVLVKMVNALALVFGEKDYTAFIDYVNTEVAHYKREVIGQKAKAPSTSGSSSVTTPDNGNKPSSGGSTSGSGSKPSGGSSSSGDNEIEG